MIPVLELNGVMVSGNHLDNGFLAGAVDRNHIEEAFPAICILRFFISRKGRKKFIGDIDAVDHDAFGCTWMDGKTLETDLRP